jgi:hypothetical protein
VSCRMEYRIFLLGVGVWDPHRDRLFVSADGTDAGFFVVLDGEMIGTCGAHDIESVYGDDHFGGLVETLIHVGGTVTV